MGTTPLACPAFPGSLTRTSFVCAGLSRASHHPCASTFSPILALSFGMRTVVDSAHTPSLGDLLNPFLAQPIIYSLGFHYSPGGQDLSLVLLVCHPSCGPWPGLSAPKPLQQIKLSMPHVLVLKLAPSWVPHGWVGTRGCPAPDTGAGVDKSGHYL